MLYKEDLTLAERDALITLRMSIIWWSVCGALTLFVIACLAVIVSSASDTILYDMFFIACWFLGFYLVGWVTRWLYKQYIYWKYPRLKPQPTLPSQTGP